MVVIVLTLAVAVICALVLASSVTGSGEKPDNGPGTSNIDDTPPEYVFVPFGSIVVNLAEGRLTRYLKVTITMQVEEDAASEISTIIRDEKFAMFQNWLLTFLSDLQLEDVRGSGAINRIRREVLDGFNALLAQYSEHRIEAVLFEEFNVQ